MPVALERGYYVSFAGNVTYPKAADLREAAKEVPADRILAETDSPYLAPQPLRGRPNEPAFVVHTLRVLAEARGEDPDELAARIDDNATAAFGLGEVRDLSVAPKKSLGQHFLVDQNLLGVIGRLAELEPDDVVLEVGPGLGVLTRYLADRVELVHAIELDRGLEPSLALALAGLPNVELTFEDALGVDPGSLRPPPRKLVANLPYNIATPLIAETLAGANDLDLWCVMVQREVADRLFAVPSTKAYGAVSVLVRLTASRTGFHPVSRTVFRPPPNVDSALVAFRRVAAPETLADVRGVVEGAFSHRRKTLANSLQLAGVADRERSVEALAAIGRPANVRAEALEPAEFVALTDALAVR